MNDLFGGLFSIIWILVLFSIFKNARSKGKGSGFRRVERKLERVAERLEKSEPPEIIEDYVPEQESAGRRKARPGEARPAKSLLRDTSALSATMTEDRQRDWLARQIREEKKRVVWNNFVDLGAAHDEACAAELNRRDHAKHHQSYVVDDGVSDN